MIESTKFHRCSFCLGCLDVKTIPIGIGGFYNVYPMLCAFCRDGLFDYINNNFKACGCGATLDENKNCTECNKGNISLVPLPPFKL